MVSKGVTAYMQIQKCVVKFCQSDEFKHASASLMMLKLCKLDNILIETAN